MKHRCNAKICLIDQHRLGLGRNCTVMLIRHLFEWRTYLFFSINESNLSQMTLLLDVARAIKKLFFKKQKKRKWSWKQNASFADLTSFLPQDNSSAVLLTRQLRLNWWNSSSFIHKKHAHMKFVIMYYLITYRPIYIFYVKSLHKSSRRKHGWFWERRLLKYKGYVISCSNLSNEK